MSQIKTYLVGGAVRDHLLGRSTHDRDWVVVGANTQIMLDAGYQQVGHDFPVFLHPETREEYALARQERKTGAGYQGFAFDTSESVTLEQDLKRRDLTINAMAFDEQQQLIDPFNGQADIERRVLRHVSSAFVEDPLRVLRVARFHARFAPLDFTIAPDTLALMRTLVTTGELEQLTPERIWLETQKALSEQRPDVYFQTLHDVGALAVILPELDALAGVPQSPQYHPEIDTFVHVMYALRASVHLTHDLDVRMAVLLHDLGKGITPKDILPRHIAHEARGLPLVKAVCERLKVSKSLTQLALKVCAEHLLFHQCMEMRPKKLLALFKRIDAFRQPKVFEQWLLACEADSKGRGATESDWAQRLNDKLPQKEFLTALFTQASKVRFEDIPAGLQGPAIGAAMDDLRLEAMTTMMQAQAAIRAQAES